MKKTLGNLLFYTFCGLLFLLVLGQVGILPLRFVYLRSGSMRPTYQPGDMAFLYVGRNIKVKTGDVVLFSSKAGPTIHRVISIENGLITTQGDANNTPDNPPIKQVEGKLLFSIPEVGFVIDYLQIPFRAFGQIFQKPASQ